MTPKRKSSDPHPTPPPPTRDNTNHSQTDKPPGGPHHAAGLGRPPEALGTVDTAVRLLPDRRVQDINQAIRKLQEMEIQLHMQLKRQQHDVEESKLNVDEDEGDETWPGRPRRIHFPRRRDSSVNKYNASRRTGDGELLERKGSVADREPLP